MSQDKPLPFQYQFAAGAVAGVSEVALPAHSRKAKANSNHLDPGDVNDLRIRCASGGGLMQSSGTPWMLLRLEC